MPVDTPFTKAAIDEMLKILALQNVGEAEKFYTVANVLLVALLTEMRKEAK